MRITQCLKLILSVCYCPQHPPVILLSPMEQRCSIGNNIITITINNINAFDIDLRNMT